ncbi:MAG: hypothetical protein WCP55_12370 [Lentisphaerota bacterium]
MQSGLGTARGSGLGLRTVELDAAGRLDGLLSTWRSTCSSDAARNAEPPRVPPCQALSSRQGFSGCVEGKIDSITVSLTVADGTVGAQPVFNTALRRVQYGKYGNVAFMVTLQGVMESHYTKSNHALR